MRAGPPNTNQLATFRHPRSVLGTVALLTALSAALTSGCSQSTDTAARNACEAKAGVGQCLERDGEWVPVGSINGTTTTVTTAAVTSSTTTATSTTAPPPSTATPSSSAPTTMAAFEGCPIGRSEFPTNADFFAQLQQTAECALAAWISGDHDRINYFSTPNAYAFFLSQPAPTDALHVQNCEGNTALYCEVVDDKGVGFMFWFDHDNVTPELLSKVTEVERIP